VHIAVPGPTASAGILLVGGDVGSVGNCLSAFLTLNGALIAVGGAFQTELMALLGLLPLCFFDVAPVLPLERTLLH
jgi:hypothetical protein